MLKKLRVLFILLAIMFVAYAIFVPITFRTQRPEIEKAEFPFSVTYEYDGEIATVEDVIVCEFAGSVSYDGVTERYWDGYVKDGDRNSLRMLKETEDETLALQVSINADYLMGDPDPEENVALNPFGEYYDYRIENDERTDEEKLESVGFRVISWECADPIENNPMFFSGIQFSGDSVVPLMTLAFIFFIACIIFVRKEKEYKYSYLDKSTRIVNIILGVVAFPFMTILSILSDINGGGEELIYQIMYTVPAIMLITFGLSVALRRKGYSKTAFFIQFTAIALDIILLFAETMMVYAL